MQEVSKSDGGSHNNDNNSSENSSPDLSNNQFLSPLSQFQFDTVDFTSYPSMFLPHSNSLSFSPSEYSFEEELANSIATDNRLYEASVVLEYQQLFNRYAMCLGQLQKSAVEVDALRLENDNLRLFNSDLVKRLSLLSPATPIQNRLLSAAAIHPPSSFINNFNRIRINGGTVRETQVRREEVSDNTSPTSVIQHDRLERRDGQRISLPKSISVRSSGFLKMNPRVGGNRGPSLSSTHHRVTSPGPTKSQRVYVPGGKREEEALEFDVYNQGMSKTELCNKWQETGTCPYGDECQFAHGITELRPVIRHPRYKTEVCRMVLGGGSCPYGHRCHFRHTLSPEERLLCPV